MIPHVSEEQLNDWADGSLANDERERVERHFAACAHCRQSADALRALLHAVDLLPKEIAPPDALRSAIHARIDAQPDGLAARAPLRSSVHWSDRSLRVMRLPLAAAAVLVIALTATLTTMVVRGNPERPADVVGDASFLALEARYREAAAELETLLRDARGALPPGTIALLDRDLAVLDAAVREARNALELDPGNPTLTSILLASYEKKLDLLRFAADAQSL